MAASRRTHDALQVALFLLVLAAPPIGGLLGVGRLGSEKRRLAEVPSLLPTSEEVAGSGSWLAAAHGSLEAFPRRFNRYHDDHFGFRAPMISLYGLVLVRGLGASPNPVVALGRDGWLFYQAQDALETWRASRPFPPEDLARWTGRAAQIQEWLEDRGVRFVLLVVPAKPVVVPEHLPARVHRVGDRTRGETFLAELERSTDMRALYPLEELRAGKALAPVYPRTDSHWNTFGALVGALAVVDVLREEWPGIEPLDPAALELRIERQPGGDLAALCGLTSFLVEDAVVLDPPEGAAWSFEGLLPTRPGRLQDEVDRPFADRRLQAGASTRDDQDAPDLLLFHDSFGDALVPWLAAHVRRGVYYRQLFVDPEVVDRERPDVVVVEIGERALLRSRLGRLAPAIRRDFSERRAFRAGAPCPLATRGGAANGGAARELAPELPGDEPVDAVLRLELRGAAGSELQVLRHDAGDGVARRALRRTLELDHEVAYARLPDLRPGEVLEVRAPSGASVEASLRLAP